MPGKHAPPSQSLFKIKFDADQVLSQIEREMSNQFDLIPLCKGDIVRFHTPLPDESPAHTYTLLDSPIEAEAQAAKLRSEGFPKYRAQVSIQLVCNLTFKPISTVPLSDLIKA